MALESTQHFGMTQRYGINPKAGRTRRAMPFLRNVPGKRYVRDQSKPGLVPKLIAR